MKPVVHFTGIAQPFVVSDGMRAHVTGVMMHPSLGTAENVMTSKVEKVEENLNGDIVFLETKNTIYKRTVQ